MASASWIDPGQTVGVALPTHPVTGEVRSANQSILSFARRHGWTVQELTDPDGFYTDVLLRKEGRNTVELHLWPGRTKRIALATINNVQLPQELHFPIRERVERYLAGVDCSCTPDPNLYTYEQKQESSCPIHGEAL